MDVVAHHRAQRGIHRAMPSKRRHARECGGADVQGEVSVAVAGTSVADMPMAVIADFQPLWRKRLLQQGAHALDARTVVRDAHGSTGLNGRTSTRA